MTDKLVVVECPKCGAKDIHRKNKYITFCSNCNYSWNRRGD